MPNPIRKKQRTRQHVIADLGANHVEKIALLCGHSIERIEKDYGYDLLLFTYDKDGFVEAGLVYIQVKATENIRFLKSSKAISFTLEQAHLGSWRDEPMPVILAVYDAKQERAYWMYVQAYLGGQEINTKGRRTATVRIDRRNMVDNAAVKLWCEYKSDVLSQLDGVIKHRA